MTAPTSDLENSPHALYRFFDTEGRLLYVGLTVDPGNRWKAHSKQKSWWPDVRNVTLEWFSTRTEVTAAEKAAIQIERPAYNVVYQPPTPKPIKVKCVVRPLLHLRDRTDWLTVTEVLEVFRDHSAPISRAAVYGWIRRGVVTHRQVGSCRLVNPADLVDLLTYHETRLVTPGGN